nr:unnamed protein product [Digitaria exilis]
MDQISWLVYEQFSGEDELPEAEKKSRNNATRRGGDDRDLKSEATREGQRKDHDKFSETEEKRKSRPR